MSKASAINRLLTLTELRERMLLVTGNITDMSEDYFSKAASKFGLDIAYVQDERTRKHIIDEIENQAIILADKSGSGILMFPLEDWVAFKQEARWQQ